MVTNESFFNLGSQTTFINGQKKTLTLKINDAQTASSVNFVFPTNNPDVSGRVLTSDASGNTQWSSPTLTNPALTNPGGDPGSIQYNNANAFDGVSEFSYDENGKKLTVSNVDISGDLAVNGNSSLNNVAISGGLAVNGNSSLNNVAISGGLDVINGIQIKSDSGGSGGIQLQQLSEGSMWNFNIYSSIDNDLGIFYNEDNIFFYTANGKFVIRQKTNSTSAGLVLQPSGSGSSWILVNIPVLGLYFYYGAYLRGYLANHVNEDQIDFTGQHRSLLNKNIDNSSIGLIVSSTGKYVNLDNSLKSNINESLPVCEITSIENDKKVFGVLSDKEDTENTRSYNTGNWASVYTKQNINEQRMYINSVGEGGIWVCNKNGNIENGDYISSSNVPGYGMKQTDDLLHNYTVAKITCNCQFSTSRIVKQKLKVITTTLSEEVKLKDENDNEITTIQDKIITEIDYDANGDVQYEDDLDENNNQQMVYEHDTRFLLPDGTQIPEEDYNTRLGNGETVYVACFVGCTYHCG